jgi:dipeptidyl aminopeptidase/acylaminoacyl peptidase
VLPAGAKKGDGLPTIVTLYPGADYSGFGLHYGGGDISTMPTPLFTTRGYAVLLVDVPLTPEGQSSNPMAEIVGVVVPQVKRAAELGYTDLDRVAVTGQSYGGYGTACLASGTNLFAAAVPVAGVFDLAGLYAAPAHEDEDDGTMTNMVWSEQSQGRMGKPLWEEPKRYIDNSPYFQADRIHTPLLIIHGQADTTCPVQESEKLFNALRRLERTAQLAVYEGEGHVPSEWSRENFADLAERVLAFLNRHLKSQTK